MVNKLAGRRNRRNTVANGGSGHDSPTWQLVVGILPSGDYVYSTHALNGVGTSNPHVSSKSRRRARRPLMCAHMSRGFSFRLLAQCSSRVTMCPMASAPASRLLAALDPPRVLWLQLPPPGSGQLRGCHVSCSSRSRLPTQGSSGVATCPIGALQAGSH
jgi:hypothetical protein